MGQVDLVLHGLSLLGPKVSYTLTTGILIDPIAKGTAAAMVNGAVEVARAAAIDVDGQQRGMSYRQFVRRVSTQYEGFFLVIRRSRVRKWPWLIVKRYSVVKMEPSCGWGGKSFYIDRIVALVGCVKRRALRYLKALFFIFRLALSFLLD